MARRLLLVLVLCLLFIACAGNEAAYQHGYQAGLEDGMGTCIVPDIYEPDELEAAWEEGFQKGVKEAKADCNVCLHRPTYQEMLDFLVEDTADLIEGKCVCMERAAALCAHAAALDIHVIVVFMNFKSGSGHVIVAFDTTDRGLIYIEPARDQEVEVAVGYDYNKNFESCSYPKIIKKLGIFYHGKIVKVLQINSLTGKSYKLSVCEGGVCYLKKYFIKQVGILK